MMTPGQVTDLRGMIASGDLTTNAFSVLRGIAALTNSDQTDENDIARELTIRLMERRPELPADYVDVLDSLVRAHGLFPYLEPGLLSSADLIAYEAFRPAGFPRDDLVFHRVQATIYHRLLSGENIVLSAPTSFGKSLIIDALLATGKYSNVVLIVPTLALIDETRRRIAQRFGSRYKVVTHPVQKPAEKNVFIYTQERAVDHQEFPKIDLFVIDEFYKLDSSDEERSGLLNQALYRLLKTGAQFYFLGPNVQRIAPLFEQLHRANFFHTDYSTVAVDLVRVPRRGSDLETLTDLCRSLRDPTLVYCQSPNQARQVAAALLAAGIGTPVPELKDAAEWVATNYDPEWLVGRALANGVGIHHGKLPRSLAQFIVRSFNAGRLPFLACTSTLIEGVNTTAKNVVIYSNRIATRQFDFFTFNNIRGRSGRMSRHFVGRVYLFHPEPPARLPEVDVPVVTQPSKTPSSLLIQLEAADLTPASRTRLQPIYSQTVLPLDTIKRNRGVDPELQVTVASDIRRRAEELHTLLGWTRVPTWEQLKEASTLVWRLSGFEGRVAGVSSGPQLALKLRRISATPMARQFIESLAAGDRERAGGDERVEGALEFARQWVGHHAPRLFLALDEIQRDVFSARQMRPGNYRFYVSRLQDQFLPASFSALDEYGLPVEVALRIQTELRPNRDLDVVLDNLRRLSPDALPLSQFERGLLVDAQRSLGAPYRGGRDTTLTGRPSSSPPPSPSR